MCGKEHSFALLAPFPTRLRVYFPECIIKVYKEINGHVRFVSGTCSSDRAASGSAVAIKE
jgi:hypothetical protein